MLNNTDGASGVSNCYVFKSRLQEYAQKVGLPTPLYETIKEGPSHEPSFRSTVIINDVRYDSLPGFFNRKAAEQSAAEVALMMLARSGEDNKCISQPVHETGLCKNLLQEYAQKMNYAIPLYNCQKEEEAPGREPIFKCSIEIGGIHYIGASAKTKKEAEIKAARTALLAIQSSASSDQQISDPQLTVIPCKKRGAETSSVPEKTANVPKAKKGRSKKKNLKRKFSGERVDCTQGEITGHQDLVAESVSESEQALGEKQFQDQKLAPCVKRPLASCVADSSKVGQSIAADFNRGIPAQTYTESNGNTTAVTGVREVASMVNNSIQAQVEAPGIMARLNPLEERIEATGESHG